MISQKELNRIAQGIDYILSNQNKDGSFGIKSDLNIDSFVTTCQVVSLLLEIGYPPYDNVIDNAIDFLLSFKSEGPVVSYWRLEPLSKYIEFVKPPENITKTIELDLELLYDTIKIGGGSPKPKTVNLPLFGLKMINNLKLDKPDWIELFINRAFQQWLPDERKFFGVININSMAFSVLPHFKWKENESLSEESFLKYINAVILNNAISSDVGVTWDNRIATTAYICLNISQGRADLITKELISISSKAKKWLLCQQSRKGYWKKSDNITKQAVRSNEYYSSVALRGIIASLKTENYNIYPIVWGYYAKLYKKREQKASFIGFILALAIGIYFLIKLVLSIHSKNSLFIPIAGLIVSTIGALPVFKSFFSYLKEKL